MKKLAFLIIASCMSFAIPVKSQEIKIDTLKSSSTAMGQLKEDLKAGVDDFDSAKNMNECCQQSPWIDC
jgi:hypothetical protein